jgi:hypothetical protein
MKDAGMPMPTLVLWMPMPTYAYQQWWASLHDVITALQIGRYQFCSKR